LGTSLAALSYFTYGVALSQTEARGGLVLASAALAGVAFVSIAYVSGRDQGWKRSLQAGLVMLLLALPLGLLSRLIGAAAGLAVGVAVALNPPRLPNVFRNRLLAVLLSVAYAFLLLVVVPPAGVMTGAILPPLMVGFADEFTAWGAARRNRSGN
jgi:hypothetical protein